MRGFFPNGRKLENGKQQQQRNIRVVWILASMHSRLEYVLASMHTSYDSYSLEYELAVWILYFIHGKTTYSFVHYFLFVSFSGLILNLCRCMYNRDSAIAEYLMDTQKTASYHGG